MLHTKHFIKSQISRVSYQDSILFIRNLIFYGPLWSLETIATKLHYFISCSSVTHQSLINRSSVAHQLLISHSSVGHQSLISRSSVAHQSLISCSSVAHQSLISRSLVVHQSFISRSSVVHQSLISRSSVNHQSLISRSSITHQSLRLRLLSVFRLFLGKLMKLSCLAHQFYNKNNFVPAFQSVICLSVRSSVDKTL